MFESEENFVPLVDPKQLPGPPAFDRAAFSLLDHTRPHTHLTTVPLHLHSLPLMSSISEEVAADFRDALQDLKVNSRPEISNLTLIAKENTEHAQAISLELENHIRTVSSYELMS